MRRLQLFLLPLLAILLFIGFSAGTAQSSVTAEAIELANLRATTDVSSMQVGQITAGTRYPVIARSSLFPWLLLGDPASSQPLGWVYRDLVNVQGDVNTLPDSTLVIGAAAIPTLAAIPSSANSAAGGTPSAPAATAPPASAASTSSGRPTFATLTPTPPPTDAPASSVTGVVLGEINVRYGPGVEFPRLGVAVAGDRFAILGTHTQLPWVRVAYAASPTGEAWLAQDLLTIEGDLASLPATSATQFTFPTLTPTPSAAQESSGLLALGVQSMPNSPEFAALGDQLWAEMLAQGFDPATSRNGAFFLMNLGTGESVSYGDDIAYSGMSVNKIAILVTYFAMLNSAPDDAQAFTLAEAMVCSENISTNEMLAFIGGGNPYTGAERVSEFLTSIGLTRTFIFTPYANDPFITPQSPLSRTTDADQLRAQPDPFNQLTVSEIGGLLYSVYTCAYGETGPLLTRLPEGTLTPSECRRILNLMTYNRIGALIEVGVPADVRVAHKHGWIQDTHGDAAIVFSPAGDYIFVMVLHGPDTLVWEGSSALIEESSRTVYNAFNPDAPLAEVRFDEGVGDLAACNASLLGSPIIDNLRNDAF